jgi:methylsterol monooxygenase
MEHLSLYVYDNLNQTRLPISLLAASANAGLFERCWRHIDNNYTKFEFITLGSFVIHLIVYLILTLPNTLYIFSPCAKRHKIQQSKPQPKLSDVWNVFKYVMFNQFCVELPGYAFVKMYTDWANIPYDYDSIGLWYHYVVRILLAFMLEDAWHYVMHRLLHHKRVYHLVHKKHHEYTSPFSMTAEYAHPVETVILGMGFFLGVFLLCDHVFFMHLWMCCRLFETIDVHSGYHFFWNPLHLVPFYGGAKAHDAHHQRFNGNYSSTFTYLDIIFGTAIEANKDE